LEAWAVVPVQKGTGQLTVSSWALAFLSVVSGIDDGTVNSYSRTHPSYPSSIFSDHLFSIINVASTTMVNYARLECGAFHPLLERGLRRAL
jgi:hypothetical protein